MLRLKLASTTTPEARDLLAIADMLVQKKRVGSWVGMVGFTTSATADSITSSRPAVT